MRAVALLALLLAACSSPPNPPPPPAMERGLVVLGIDGMDYALTKRLMREGRLPNLQKLAERGGFWPLGTTDPPQSPVAWSTFITGMGPDGHGIYDFVHRDTADMSPYLSTSRVEEPETFTLGEVAIPLGEASVELLRRGQAFWEVLDAEDVPVTIYKVPANFPPDEAWRARTLSGMGTPDLLGTYGTFQVFSNAPEHEDATLSGGLVRWLDFDGQHAKSSIEGPPNAYSVDGTAMTVPLELVIDAQRDVALLRLDEGETELVLVPGEWTGWVPIAFDAGLLFGSVPGMVRFYVKQLRPHAIVYMSPINLDPSDSAMPISSPRAFAEEIADGAGRFYTQGMPEDTKALAAEVLSDDDFLTQAEYVLEERIRLLDYALSRYRGGALFFYFSSIDQVSHVFYRTLDVPEDHALAAYRDTIPALYEKLDAQVGRVMAWLPEGSDLIVLSDHGFAPYTRKVHLNTWLLQRGYLALHEGGKRGEGALGHIDWSRTQAYALGLNQLFINLEGREPHGIVPQDERALLVKRLTRELEGFRDPDTGARVVTRIVEPDTKAFPKRAPDLIVGYGRGYRSSDSSAVGLVGQTIIEDNHEKWSGDHCMDPRAVPGVFFASRPLAFEGYAGLVDMAPTILDFFDVAVPDSMQGRSLWTKPQ